MRFQLMFERCIRFSNGLRQYVSFSLILSMRFPVHISIFILLRKIQHVLCFKYVTQSILNDCLSIFGFCRIGIDIVTKSDQISLYDLQQQWISIFKLFGPWIDMWFCDWNENIWILFKSFLEVSATIHLTGIKISIRWIFNGQRSCTLTDSMDSVSCYLTLPACLRSLIVR